MSRACARAQRAWWPRSTSCSCSCWACGLRRAGACPACSVLVAPRRLAPERCGEADRTAAVRTQGARRVCAGERGAARHVPVSRAGNAAQCLAHGRACALGQNAAAGARADSATWCSVAARACRWSKSCLACSSRSSTRRATAGAGASRVCARVERVCVPLFARVGPACMCTCLCPHMCACSGVACMCVCNHDQRAHARCRPLIIALIASTGYLTQYCCTELPCALLPSCTRARTSVGGGRRGGAQTTASSSASGSPAASAFPSARPSACWSVARSSGGVGACGGAGGAVRRRLWQRRRRRWRRCEGSGGRMAVWRCGGGRARRWAMWWTTRASSSPSVSAQPPRALPHAAPQTLAFRRPPTWSTTWPTACARWATCGRSLLPVAFHI